MPSSHIILDIFSFESTHCYFCCSFDRDMMYRRSTARYLPALTSFALCFFLIPAAHVYVALRTHCDLYMNMIQNQIHFTFRFAS